MPARTAAPRVGPSHAEGPGISRSRPASAGRPGRVRAEPVGHDQPVESPLVAQDATEQVGLLAAVDPVDLVVGGHHGPDVGLLDSGFEGDEVDLPKGALVHLGADGHPLVFLVVAGVVLDATGHPVALDAAHVGDGDASGQARVLRVGLEGATGQWRAGDAHRGAEQDVDTFGLGLGRQHLAHALDELGVPGGADGHAAGERQGAASGQALAAYPRGAVGHFEGGDAEALDRRDEPQAGAGGEGRLLIEGQSRQQVVDARRNRSNRTRSIQSFVLVDGRASRAFPSSAPLLPRPQRGRRRSSAGGIARCPLVARWCRWSRSACWHHPPRHDEAVIGRGDGIVTGGGQRPGAELPVVEPSSPSERFSPSGRSRAVRGCRSRSRYPRRSGTRPRAPDAAPATPHVPVG